MLYKINTAIGKLRVLQLKWAQSQFT